jgi:putative ABC transport system permease protein
MACGQGLALPDANRSLGLQDGVGTANLDGAPIAIVGERPVPAGLSFLSTSVLVLSCDDASIKELVVVADEPRIVPDLISALLSLFTTDERSRLQLESDVDEVADSEAVALAAERSAQSTSVTGTAGATGATALLLAAMVVQRRRDFGRRRALGATRAWVSVLIVVQAWIMAVTAWCLAVAVIVAVSAVSEVTTPDASFVAGLGLMLMCAAPVGGLVAGSLAATGDPLREIRVP